MKLSLAWIFDHIEAHWKDQDINLIYKKFNEIVGEIEMVESYNIALDNFFLAQGKETTAHKVTLDIPELSQSVVLPARTKTVDIINPEIKQPVFMIKKDTTGFSWATLADFKSEKEGYLPAFDVETYDLQGRWRSVFESEDIILEVDNKSLTHRPDMWGHRGFAREIAAFLNLPFLHEDDFLKKHNILYAQHTSPKTVSMPFVIENQVSKACKKFVGLYFKTIENKQSHLLPASRLLKIGLRPMNALIDLTNYIAADWSQPIHAYDADKIAGKKVIIRMAKENEKLDLLDGNSIELTPQDLVIADTEKPMCLAGVKGGVGESISEKTKAIFFEAACFDAGFVRKSALYHKTRTDSSARYEKTLDPNQTITAVWRFLKLLEDYNIKAAYADEMVAVGIPPVQEQVIEVKHSFLERRMGVVLTEQDIVKTLSRIGFKVLESYLEENKEEKVYLIGVPTFRGSKDIKIKEDILEEVVRWYGFNNIPLELPKIARPPFDTQLIMRERKLKNYLAYAVNMTEVQSYAFFDEQNLDLLGLNFHESIKILNPVSENYMRLVTTLLPGLFKCVRENQVQRETLSFFEIGKIWPVINGSACEQKSLGGIFFEKRKSLDFYACKAKVNGIFKALGLDERVVSWQKVEENVQPWSLSYQTAQIKYQDFVIGYAGMVDKAFLIKTDVLPESESFVFELNVDFLCNKAARIISYESISKFQDTYFDISILVPLTVAVAQFEDVLQTMSPFIKQVNLIDFFEKAEWKNQRSLTFRIWVSHQEKTFSKEEIDAIWENVVSVVQSMGAQLRTLEN